MASSSKPKVRRVVSCDGSAWKTDAQGAGDYLFNPVFMMFFFLIVILYATMMQPSEQTALPIPAQMILWGGLIMTSLVWLFVSVVASIVAYDRGLLNAIYTPLLLLPLVFINASMAQFTLSVFSAGYQGSYGSMVENISQNAIIIIVFDILHARFVAPQHPRYISDQSEVAYQGVSPSSIDPAADASHTGAPLDVEPVAASEEAPTESPSTESNRSEPQKYIEFAREKFEASSILWVKSEDHYLSIQLKDRNIMRRGKLRTAVDELGEHLGIQINRSVWVAFSAIRLLEEQTSGNLDVHLEDESVHRVSNSRRLMFKQNYDRFKAEMVPIRDDQQTEG